MDVTEQELLDRCMKRMAEGDHASLFTFAQTFGSRVAQVVRRILTEMGRRDVLADPDELNGLVSDACWVIYERASGWKPGKALPWTWAERAIRSQIARSIGHRTVPVHDEAVDIPDPRAECESEDAVVTFAGLARQYPLVALLADAVSGIGTPRDQRVFIEYRLQKELGDPSPSHVVAREFGISPANVRQIYHRMRKRLAAVVAADPRYAPLGEMRWLAA